MDLKNYEGLIGSVDKKAIEMGVAEKRVHNYILQRAEGVTDSQKVADNNTKIIEALQKAGLIIGQYDTERSIFADYDLWFWCNHDKYGRMMNYITLSVNAEKSVERQNEITAIAEKVFSDIDFHENSITVQYVCKYDEKKLKEVVSEYVESIQGKWVYNGFACGKVWSATPENFGDYGYPWYFKKKGARTNAFLLKDKDVFDIMVQNRG